MRIPIDRLLLVLALRLLAAAGIVMPAAAQTFTEFPLPSRGGPFGITTGPDGALWFTEYVGNKIGRITTAGSITEFPTITLNSNSHSIITGPDGALWFTEEGAGKIGRILATATPTDPQLTEFEVPREPGTGPYRLLYITTGRDGALWFTETTQQKIGRITTTGLVTSQFAAPGEPEGITSGPDGALWIANGNYIDKMTTEGTAGQITRFRVPSGAAYYITPGPDGAFWFTEQIAGKIGRITTAGEVTEFALPKDVLPSGITTGPDGALWFTEGCIRQPHSGCIPGNKIGRITTTGVVTEFTIPSPRCEPEGITTGPDGALWFTEYGGNKIGRLVLH
jgi:virginiamycin B lyase